MQRARLKSRDLDLLLLLTEERIRVGEGALVDCAAQLIESRVASLGSHPWHNFSQHRWAFLGRHFDRRVFTALRSLQSAYNGSTPNKCYES